MPVLPLSSGEPSLLRLARWRSAICSARFPFGVLLTRFAGLGDIRKVGSGNIGATNVLRTGHKGLAAATLLGDGLKGTAAVLIGAPSRRRRRRRSLAALGAFLGHLFPVWLGFRGGKGVATLIGCLHRPR